MRQQRANGGCSFVASSSPQLDLLTGFSMKHPVNMQASDVSENDDDLIGPTG